MRHIGVSAYRIKQNPLEGRFAAAWQKIADNTLGYLLYGQEKHDHAVTPRDAEIAATIIQWLGSPVGESFVRGVLK